MRYAGEILWWAMCAVAGLLFLAWMAGLLP
jgi:hypothetical protein